MKEAVEIGDVSSEFNNNHPNNRSQHVYRKLDSTTTNTSLSEDVTDERNLLQQQQQQQSINQVLGNFIIMSILFSANHGAMVSCLAFATLQLGSTGAWELSLFHMIYAASSMLGATYVVKQLGSRTSMLVTLHSFGWHFY